MASDLITNIISVFAAVGSAIAAFMSWLVARRSLILQKELATDDHERYLYESLRKYADNVNGYVKGKQQAEWSFSDAANIIFNLNSAMQMISQNSLKDGATSSIIFKKFFTGQLVIELQEVFNRGGLDGVLSITVDADSLEANLSNLWHEVSDFFGFMWVRDEDLAD